MSKSKFKKFGTKSNIVFKIVRSDAITAGCLISDYNQFNWDCWEVEFPIDLTNSLEEDLVSEDQNDNLSLGIELMLESDDLAVADIAFLRANLNKKMKQFFQAAEIIKWPEFTIPEVLAYINKNPILKTKQHILYDDTLDYKLIAKIKTTIPRDYLKQFKFKIPENGQPISFTEYEKTLQLIDSEVQTIKKFNFSPLENVIAAYDLVRNRVYQKGKEGNLSSSRDLSLILTEPEITCMGYANHFNALIKRLGIKGKVSFFKSNSDNGGSHARNEVEIQDSKYKIDGIYYFDPTFDRKRQEGDNSYLNCYRFLALTKDELSRLDNGEWLDICFPCSISSLDYQMNKVIKNKDCDYISKKVRCSINHLAYLNGGDNLIYWINFTKHYPNLMGFNLEKEDFDYSKLNEVYRSLVKKFKKPIQLEKLLTAIFTVKKCWYYVNPTRYSLQTDNFKKILSSLKLRKNKSWFEVLATLVKQNLSSSVDLEIDPELNREITGVKLARVLKTKLEHLTSSNEN